MSAEIWVSAEETEGGLFLTSFFHIEFGQHWNAFERSFEITLKNLAVTPNGI